MKTTKQLILQKSRALDAREKEETEEEEERDEEQEEEKEEEEEEAEEEEEDGRAKRLILKLDLGKRAARGQFQLPFLQSISIFSKRNSWSEKYKQKTQQEKSKSKISNHHIWYQYIYIYIFLLLLLFNPSGGATEEIGRGEEKRKEKKKKWERQLDSEWRNETGQKYRWWRDKSARKRLALRGGLRTIRRAIKRS